MTHVTTFATCTLLQKQIPVFKVPILNLFFSICRYFIDYSSITVHTAIVSDGQTLYLGETFRYFTLLEYFVLLIHLCYQDITYCKTFTQVLFVWVTFTFTYVLSQQALCTFTQA